MFLTFNNQEWIPGPDFKYHDHSITRIAYATAANDPAAPEYETWNEEQPEEVPTEELTEEEIAKREEEK